MSTAVHIHLQLAVVQLLPDMLERNSKIKLVVIDSIAFHFRREFEDMSLRTRLLNGMAQQLLKVTLTLTLTLSVHECQKELLYSNLSYACIACI